MLRNRSICPSPREIRLAKAQVALRLPPPPVLTARGVGRINSSGDRRDVGVEHFISKITRQFAWFSYSEVLYLVCQEFPDLA